MKRMAAVNSPSTMMPLASRFRLQRSNRCSDMGGERTEREGRGAAGGTAAARLLGPPSPQEEEALVAAGDDHEAQQDVEDAERQRDGRRRAETVRLDAEDDGVDDERRLHDTGRSDAGAVAARRSIEVGAQPRRGRSAAPRMRTRLLTPKRTTKTFVNRTSVCSSDLAHRHIFDDCASPRARAQRCTNRGAPCRVNSTGRRDLGAHTPSHQRNAVPNYNRCGATRATGRIQRLETPARAASSAAGAWGLEVRHARIRAAARAA